MFLEKQLKQAFHRKGKHLGTSRKLDQRIDQLYDRYVAEEQEGRGQPNTGWSFFHRFPKVAVIALALLLFTGFAFGVTHLFSIELDSVKFEVGYDQELKLVHTSTREILAQIEQVRVQLEPGEAAMVYLPELEKEPHSLIKQFPFVKISQPILYHELDAWKEHVGYPYAAIKRPEFLPEGFAFVGGATDLELMGTVAEAGLQASEELKQRAAGQFAWEKYEAAQEASPTFIYQNEQDEQILISASLLEDVIKIESTMNGVTAYDRVNIRGFEGVFTSNPNHIFVEGEVQSLSWLEQQEEGVFLYHIHTSSAHVTKDDLLRLAESMR